MATRIALVLYSRCPWVLDPLDWGRLPWRHEIFAVRFVAYVADIGYTSSGLPAELA